METTKQEMRFTYYYLQALTEPEGGRSFKKVMDELGEVQLYVYKDKHAPNRIAFMRRPRILVYDKGNNALSGYAAVFLCDTPEGNDYLATMEDLAHTRWHQEEARNWSAAEKEKGRLVLNGIRDWVREMLQSLASRDQESEQDIIDLADFLPAEDDVDSDNDARGSGPETREGQDAPETGLEVPRPVGPTPVLPRRVRRTTSGLVNLEREGAARSDDERDTGTGRQTGPEIGVGPDDEGSGEGSGPKPPSPEPPGPGPDPEPRPGPGPGPGPEPPRPGPNPGPMPPGPGPGTGAGDAGSHGSGGRADPDAPGNEKVLATEDVSFRSYARSATAYRIVLRANRSCKGTLHLRAVGEDSRYDLEVVRVSSGSESFVVDGTAIRGLRLKKGQSLTLDVEIRSDVKLSLGAGK